MTTTAPPPWFRGFEVRPSTTITRFCGWPEPNTAQTFLSSGSWANCCETGKTTPCSLATTCLSSSILVYNNGDRRTCEDSKTCVAQTYYQASPSVGPAVTLLMCATSLQPWPNYRSLAGAQYIAANASDIPWDYSSSFSPAATSSAATNAPVEGGGGGSGGNAHLWIAGAVIGPVVVIALGILAFWLLSRRRRRRGNLETGAAKDASSSSSSSLDGVSQANRSSSGNNDDGEETRRRAKHEHAELGTVHNLHELDSPPVTLELPAGQYPGYYHHGYSWDDAAAPGTRPHAELDSTFSPVTPCLGPDGRPERPYKGWGWFGWV